MSLQVVLTSPLCFRRGGGERGREGEGGGGVGKGEGGWDEQDAVDTFSCHLWPNFFASFSAFPRTLVFFCIEMI